MFYSKTKKRPTERLNVGEKEKTTYSMTVDKNGHKILKETGKTNFYEKIQENAEACKIENILKRATLGDSTALNRYVPAWFDATEYPTNLAEAQQAIINLENIFSTLPIEIRKEYDHSPQKFIADFGTEHWNNIMFTKVENSKESGEIVE